MFISIEHTDGELFSHEACRCFSLMRNSIVTLVDRQRITRASPFILEHVLKSELARSNLLQVLKVTLSHLQAPWPAALFFPKAWRRVISAGFT